jgi:4-hydroxy-tetrahydrodipicolinate reductase
MTRPLRLAVNGATGRMGQVLLDLLRGDARFEVAAALTAPGMAQLGERVWHDREAPCLQADWPQEPLDVVIDFSGPDGLASALDYCTNHGVALVSGTTGIDAVLRASVAEAASRIPLMHASNFSLGVAVLTRLLRQAAAALPQWDLEIVEAHHNRKTDAPSGTALSLGEAAAAARDTTLAKDAVTGSREGVRHAGAIGFAVIRGGDVVGEHTAMLIGSGERLELGHRATDRSIFARGAIEAAHWLPAQAPGAYDLEAMLAARLAV